MAPLTEQTTGKARFLVFSLQSFKLNCTQLTHQLLDLAVVFFGGVLVDVGEAGLRRHLVSVLLRLLLLQILQVLQLFHVRLPRKRRIKRKN